MPKVYLPEKPGRPTTSPTGVKDWESENADVKSLTGRVIGFIENKLTGNGNIYKWKSGGFEPMKKRLRIFLDHATEPEAKFLLKLLHDKQRGPALYRIFYGYEKPRSYTFESNIDGMIKPYIENHLSEVKSFFRISDPKPMSLKITRKGRGRKTLNCSAPKGGGEVTARVGRPVVEKFSPIFPPETEREQRDIMASRVSAPPDAEGLSEKAMKEFLVNVIKPLMLEEEARIKERAGADTRLRNLKDARVKAIDRMLTGMENVPEPVRILCENKTTREKLINLIYRNNYGSLKDADFMTRVNGLSKLTRFKAGVNARGVPMDTKIYDKDSSELYREKPFRPIDVKGVPGAKITVPGK